MTINTFSSASSRYGKYLVGIAWSISTLIYLGIHGVVTTLEADKYIREAHLYIDTGSFSAPRFYFYCVTLFILVFAIKLKIGMFGAFVIQALLNLFAYLIFLKALNRLFKHSLTPLLIILYLFLFSPYQSWVVFLYTESVFFSTILILFSVLILYKPDKIKNGTLIAIALLFTIISRPLGILFSGGVYVYLFYHADKKWKTIIACSSIILIILGYYLINIVFSTVKDWTITQGFEQESIICDLPATPPYKKLDLATTGSPVYRLLYYVFHNFSHFLHFTGIKLQYFFLMTRDYYSKSHNYFLLINTIGLYLLAITSFFIRKIKFDKGIIVFMISTILFFTITIIFQCDDYNNRFIMSIFPFFVILAARTAEFVMLFLFKNNK